MSSTSKLISTIIVSYNTADLTCKSVESVLKEYQHSQIDGEVIVVDNNSTDDSVEQLQQFGSNIQIIRNTENVGFAKANNQGITKSIGSYIFLLNSDAFVHPGAIKNLLEIFKKYPDQATAAQEATRKIDRVGMVSGKLLNKDGSLQQQGGALPSLFTLAVWWLWPFPFRLPFLSHQFDYHINDLRYFDKEQLAGWLAGTALMLRREMVSEIGLLDESIFMYAEDVEYCMRAAAHHWDIVYTPTAVITHLGSASSAPEHATIAEVTRLNYVFSKHFPGLQSFLAWKILKLGTLLRLLLFGIILGNAKQKKTYQEIFRRLSEKV